jgi:hypothetical protein
MKSSFRTVAGLIVALCISLNVRLAGAAEDESTINLGDTVMVVVDKAELGVRDKAAAMLNKGDKLHVTEVRGAWVGGYAHVNGQRISGWLNKSEVKAIRLAPISAPVIEVPDKADDPQAVAALKEAGVRLEMNDKGNVQVLNAAESKLADTEAVHFGGLHQLSSLELTGRPITDAALKSLAGNAVLQELFLGKTEITDAGLKHVRDLKNLEVLALHDTKVTDAGLAYLEGLNQLRVLNLTNCAITDEGLKHLAKLGYVEVLALPGTKVTSAGLVHLKPLARLRVLNLNGDDIEDAGLAHLMDHTELRMLYLRQTKVTDTASDKLDESMPGLAIYR